MIKRSDKIIQFIETLKLPDGKWAGEQVCLREWQKGIIRATYDPSDAAGRHLIRQALLSMGRKNAKALALNTPIPTTEGWKVLEDVHTGDSVYGTDGAPVEVLAESSIFKNKKCFLVKFSDGSEVVASEDHLWVTSHHYRPWEPPATYSSGKIRGGRGYNRRVKTGVVTTEQISQTVLRPRKDKTIEHNHKIQAAKALLLPEKKGLLIPPYVLGAWLGDGTSKGASITVGDVDLAFMEDQLNRELITPVKVKLNKNRAPTIWMTGKRGAGNSIQSKLRKIGVFGKKHLPEEYLNAGTGQRWALLQGLMDTDGTVTRHNGQTTARCSFSSSVEQLARGTWRLARSLGLKATIRSGIAKLYGVEKGVSWSVDFPADKNSPVFRMERKQKLLPEKLAKRSYTLAITSCEETVSVPTKCIAVDSEDHLFLAGHGCTPTHNTALVAFLTLCHLCGPEAVRNGQLYSLSVDREQAGVLFNYAKNIVYMDDELSKQLNVTESRKHILDPVSGSVYSVLSGEKKGKMGKSSSFVAFDELAEFGNDRTLYDALLTSTAAHEEPMVWTFSTQAPNEIALLSELIDYGEKIREGEIVDPTFISFLYQVPEEYDIWDEENWYLANPGLGDFRSLTEMRDFAAKAQRMPSMENSFRNLYLNQRIDASSPFISKAVFESCGAVPDEIDGVEVYCGLDLSARTDLTALAVMWLVEKIWHTKVFFFAPEIGVKDRAKRDGVPYDLWAKEGYLELCPGATVDYDWVVERMVEILAHCTVNVIGFDRWRIDVFKKAMERAGVEFPLEPYGQGYKDQAPALDDMEEAFLNAQIAHGNHPILKMCAANAVVTQDPANNRKLDKSKAKGRIDGLAAMSNVFGVVSKLEKEEPSIYETRGVITY